MHKKNIREKKIVHKIHPRKKNSAQKKIREKKECKKIVHKIHPRKKNSAQKKNPREKNSAQNSSAKKK